VTLRCGRAYLEVEDDGPGVSPAEQTRLLERFYRASGTTGEGSGLGLAIAQEIARVHRSRLQVMTARGGRGLLVRMELPL
jgi:two-component system sensor histidine kinase TctE